jgi:hypothetical protein
VSAFLPKIATPPTSESLRLRALAHLNGARSSEQIRKRAQRKSP